MFSVKSFTSDKIRYEDDFISEDSHLTSPFYKG